MEGRVLSETTAAERHLAEIRVSRTFAQARVQYRMLEILVSAALRRESIESGWHLAERVYGEEPAFDGSEVFYNRAKSTLSALRHSLRAYYAELAGSPPVRFVLPERGYELKIIFSPSRNAGTQAPHRVTVLENLTRWALPALGLLVAVAMIAAWGWLPRAAASLPVRVGLRDGFPVLLDRNGKEIEDPNWQAAIPTGIRIDAEAPGHHQKAQWELATNHIRAAVVDRGPCRDCPAVIVANLLHGDAAENGRLLLLDGQNGAQIDSLPLPYFPGPQKASALHFGPEEGVVPSHFHLQDLAACDLDGDGLENDVVVGLSMADFFPSQVLAVQVADRFVVRRNYWVAGHIFEPVAHDLDGDRAAEIVVSGMNNDFQQGFIAILRPDEPDGRTPDDFRRKLFREIEGLAENGFVIRFPRTEISRNPNYRTLRSLARFLDPTSQSGDFVVDVTDVLPIAPLRPGEVMATIRFHIGPDGDEVTVSFNPAYDFYLTEMKKLIATGVIADQWRIVETERLDEYSKALAERVEYWDGSESAPEWKHFTPADLRRYLAR